MESVIIMENTPPTTAPSRKTLIKETPNVKPVADVSNTVAKPEFLKDYFNCIINREILHLNSKKVGDVLVNDLGVNVKVISTRMKYILSESLCYYMKIWPGWSNTDYKNVLLRDECFNKFKEYLCFKINYIIQNERQFHKDNDYSLKETTSTETQTVTPGKSNKPEAPYSLVICGQPSVLNNIVFVEMDNNIVIKQHLEKPWKQLAPTQFFLNHPYVRVGVDLPGVRFSRCNLHEYKRYITECGDMASCPEVDFINQVLKCIPSATPKVYSYDYISTYFAQLIGILQKHMMKNRSLLQCIINEYLQDIKECNLEGGTMAEPYTVTFNIGMKTYVRNKKMVVSSNKNKDANAINFCEILIPKVSFTLLEFDVQEDLTTSAVSFVDLNAIEHMSKEERSTYLNVVNNCITFHCTLCNKMYYGERSYVDCMDHFRFLHKGEQAVLCFKCRKPFEINHLAASRWSHNCCMVKVEVGDTSVTGSVGNDAPTTETNRTDSAEAQAQSPTVNSLPEVAS